MMYLSAAPNQQQINWTPPIQLHGIIGLLQLITTYYSLPQQYYSLLHDNAAPMRTPYKPYNTLQVTRESPDRNHSDKQTNPTRTQTNKLNQQEVPWKRDEITRRKP